MFREFLRSEYSEENMLFWLACEDLKKTENPDLVEEKARLIYEDYISILSPKEVRNTDKKTWVPGGLNFKVHRNRRKFLSTCLANRIVLSSFFSSP